MKRSVLFLLLVAGTPCWAQWTRAGFPSDYPVLAFGTHDTSLFLSYPSNAGAPDSLIYRHIQPASWIPLGTGIDRTQGNITSFASLGRFIFTSPLNTMFARMLVSSDNGSHWNKLNAAGPVGTNGTYLFGQLLTDPPTLLRSRDSGKTFDSVWQLSCSSIGGTGNFVFALNNGFWRSLDNGTTWINVSTPLSSITTTAIVGTVLYAANGQLMRSIDSGASWTLVPTPFPAQHLATDGKHLFAGGSNGVYLLGTDGSTWTAESDSGRLKGHGVVALGVFDTLLFADFAVTGGFELDSRSIPEMTDTTKSAVAAAPQPSDTLSIYPNPATGRVAIVSRGASIERVIVMNLLGEKVLDVENIRAPQISMDISKLPSGTYFFEIQTSHGPQLRKIAIER